jgi:hypothetical protein
MSEYFIDAAARAAVLIPSVVASAAILWLALKVIGALRRDRPFDRLDARTWPLAAALANAALFAFVFAAAAAALRNSPDLIGGASFIAAFTTILMSRITLRPWSS